MTTPIVVWVAHSYNAPAERLFDAWLTPNQAARFLFATRTGNIMRCEIDPRVGGQFLVTDRRPMADGDESVFDAEHSGTYLEIDRPKRLVFEFAVPPYNEEPTRVTLDFIAQGASNTELVLTHELGTSELARMYEQQTRKGWTRMLERLERDVFPKRIAL
jgi:uncharacterized protein YndB with AHSA1/START domain